ncbi:hypothetical protein DXG01_004587 [Tephrocybe rancida]|nr:hypothetical protein DXG01_004587 [Tephrocybe rancida]
MHSPRPILKRSAAFNGVAPSRAVHFPPSPSLTTHTYTAYSSAAYDRSPIQVSPNSCALPERGCPGRTYTLDEQPTSTQERNPRRYYSSRGLHPRALACASSSTLPPLIPDLYSESDESDGSTSPPSDSYPPPSHLLGLPLPPDHLYSSSYDPYSPYSMTPPPITPSALAFLPHPPSDPHSPYAPFTSPSSAESPKQRRRRGERTTHDASSVPDRIPDAYDVPTIRTPTKKRVPALTRALAPCRPVIASSFRVEDDGCLGGF